MEYIAQIKRKVLQQHVLLPYQIVHDILAFVQNPLHEHEQN